LKAGHAIVVEFSAFDVGFGALERTLGVAQGDIEIAGVDAGDDVFLFDFGADDDGEVDDGAGDAKGEVDFPGGLSASGKAASGEGIDIADRHGADVTDGFFLGGLLAAATGDEEGEEENGELFHRKGGRLDGMGHRVEKGVFVGEI
jgi:hypothetical protein